jgi:large subunit ribosomal protein L10
VRPEKAAIVEEMRRRVDDAGFVLLAEYRGLKAEQMAALRGHLRGLGSRVQVVKNRLFRQVASARKWQGLESALRGPLVLVAGRDIGQTVKALRKFSADNGALPVIKAGVLGDSMLSVEDIGALGTLPDREVLLGRALGTLAAPMSRLAGAMRQKVSSLLHVLKAIERKKSA